MMDPEQRWLRIVSSFPSSSNPPPPPSNDGPHDLVTSRRRRPQQTHTSSPQTRACPTTQSNLQSDTVSHENQETIENLTTRIQQLQEALEKQSTLIRKQEELINTLKRADFTNINPPRVPLPLVNKAPFSTFSKPSHATTPTIQQVLISVEQLEFRMSKMMSSLPRRISQLCSQHLTGCKFQLDEDGEILLVTSRNDKNLQIQPVKKTIWQQSPITIPPPRERRGIDNSKLPLSTKCQSHQNQPRDSGHVQHNVNDDIRNQVERMERLVNELKICFIELLLEKVTSGRMRSCIRNINGGEGSNFENVVKRV